MLSSHLTFPGLFIDFISVIDFSLFSSLISFVILFVVIVDLRSPRNPILRKDPKAKLPKSQLQQESFHITNFQADRSHLTFDFISVGVIDFTLFSSLTSFVIRCFSSLFLLLVLIDFHCSLH